jgi:hypothetical protein
MNSKGYFSFPASLSGFRKSVVAIALLGSFLLSGCGDDKEQPIATKAADIEGLWLGSSSGRSSVLMSVFDNAVSWIAYGPSLENSSGAVTTPSAAPTNAWKGLAKLDGFIFGSLRVNGFETSSSELRDFSAIGNYSELTLKGTFVPKVSISGSLSSQSAATSLSLSASPTAVYYFGRAARIDEILGSWSGVDLRGVPTNVTIDSAAGIRIVTGDCVLLGTLVPRSPSIASENVFDLSATASSTCGTNSLLKFTGVGIRTVISNGQAQLIIMGLTEDRTRPISLLATR